MKEQSIKSKANRLLEALPEQCGYCGSTEHKSGDCDKVAGALASIDELIALQTQKLELLKKHRQGLIQRFSKHEPPAIGPKSGAG